MTSCGDEWPRSLAPAERRELERLLLTPRAFRLTYRADPCAFVHDCFEWAPGQGPTTYQDELLALLPAKRRLCVRGPHGLGKTALASWILLWFALTRDGDDWKAPTTASAWRQLIYYLWPELHKWSRRLKWGDRLGRGAFREGIELLDTSLKLATGQSFAVASNEPALIEGAHADQLLYVFDEAKTIQDSTWDAAEGAFSGAGAQAALEAYALAISTPGEPQGRFYAIHKRQPGYGQWWTRHVSRDEAISAGRMNREWAEEMALAWGPSSSLYQNRVLGEFAASDEEGIIPLAWVEAANERWREWDAAGRPGDVTRYGVDIARGGADRTVIAERRGSVIAELRRSNCADTMRVTGVVSGLQQATKAEAIVDVIGVGAGVVDRLREQSLPVVAFNAGEGTDAQDRHGILGFVNQRARAWWGLRELLDPANGDGIALPPDDLLTGDLTAPHWRPMSNGRIQVESKDEIRKRIGRSTDDGDAVVMAFAPQAPKIKPGWAFG
jgi:hypothetical protein